MKRAPTPDGGALCGLYQHGNDVGLSAEDFGRKHAVTGGTRGGLWKAMRAGRHNGFGRIGHATHVPDRDYVSAAIAFSALLAQVRQS